MVFDCWSGANQVRSLIFLRHAWSEPIPLMFHEWMLTSISGRDRLRGDFSNDGLLEQKRNFVRLP